MGVAEDARACATRVEVEPETAEVCPPGEVTGRGKLLPVAEPDDREEREVVAAGALPAVLRCVAVAPFDPECTARGAPVRGEAL